MSNKAVCRTAPATLGLRRHAQTVRDGASSHKIDYVKHATDILYLKGYQNDIIGSKVTKGLDFAYC